jgi:hypothetical protein
MAESWGIPADRLLLAYDRRPVNPYVFAEAELLSHETRRVRLIQHLAHDVLSLPW